MSKIIQWVVTHIAGWLHSVSGTDLSTALDLVVKAESVAVTGAEKLKWFADEFGKINAAIKLWHEDGNPTNALLLLASVAKDLAQKFGLIRQ